MRPQQRPQAPAGHALAPGRPAARPAPVAGGGGGGGGEALAGSWRQDTGRVARNRSQVARRHPRAGRGAVDSVAAMSSRTCAKPGCNTSRLGHAHLRLREPHGVARAPGRRGATRCATTSARDHADAPDGPAGLGAAGPPRSRRSAAASSRRPGARLDVPGAATWPAARPSAATAGRADRAAAAAAARRRAASTHRRATVRWGLGDAARRLGRRPGRRHHLAFGDRRRATGVDADEDSTTCRSASIALAQLGLWAGLLRRAVVRGHEVKGNGIVADLGLRARWVGPLVGRAVGHRDPGRPDPAALPADLRGCSTRRPTTSRARPAS